MCEDFEAALGPLVITQQRFSAMVVIAGNPGMTQGMLGRVLDIARLGGAQVVNGLQDQGWVTRKADGSDARTWLLKPTTEGKSQLPAAPPARTTRVSRRLSVAKRDQLITLLDRLGPDS